MTSRCQRTLFERPRPGCRGNARLPARRRAPWHPQLRARRLSGGVRAPRRRRIVEPFQEQGAQLIGFPGCYPSAHAHRCWRRCARIRTRFRRCSCRSAARNSAARRCSKRSEPAADGRASGHSARRRHRGDGSGRARLGRKAACRGGGRADRAAQFLRSCRGHKVRRLRRAFRHHRQSGCRQRLRPPGRLPVRP